LKGSSVGKCMKVKMKEGTFRALRAMAARLVGQLKR